MKKGLRSLQSLAVLSLDSDVRVSLRGCSGFFQRVGRRARARVARSPCGRGRRSAIAVAKMRAESKGVRAGSEAMHSDSRARKQATSTVPLSERSNRAMNRVPGGQSRAALRFLLFQICLLG